MINDEAYSEEIMHIGRSILDGAEIGSGRYRYGSGEQPFQHEPWRNWQLKYARIRDQYPEASEKEWAQMMGYNSTGELRERVTYYKEQEVAAKVKFVQDRFAEGMKPKEISEASGFVISEATVRGYLKEPKAQSLVEKNKATQVQNTMEALKKEVAEKGYLDVGKGTAENMGVSSTTLSAALRQMEKEGYYVNDIYNQRLGAKDKGTTIKTLSQNPDKQDIWENHLYDIKTPGVSTNDGGLTGLSKEGLKPPKQFPWDKLQIRYAEQGGSDLDGTIELRRGAEGLDLGRSNYAQVRIAVGGTHYLKGMAVYSDNLPPGVDIMFNTNKKEGTPRESVLKPLKLENPENPFESTIKQVNGQRGYLNVVNEEGDWLKWSHNMSSQFLAKQPLQLVKERLKATEKAAKEEYDSIMAVSNPVVRQQLLENFEGNCHTRARQLKALGTSGSCAKVILPLASMNPSEIYAPNFNNGDKVVAVRYPHAGRFELAQLTVNNNISSAAKLIGKNALDAVVIHPSVAGKLSGADFDGDTVFLFNNNNGRIKTAASLPGLKDFDPKQYATDHQTISRKYKQTQMGIVTNLISDMQTLMGNSVSGPKVHELERAVRASMVVIDAEKHKLDWKECFKKEGIQDLRKKYQSYIDENGQRRIGAATIITRAKRHMDEVDDAMKLVSDKKMPIEIAYANYANSMKALANTAKKEAVAIEYPEYNRSLGKKGGKYYNEVQSLEKQYRAVLANKPRERQAMLLASKWYNAQKNYVEDDRDAKNKLRIRLERTARDVTGSKMGKVQIHFSDKEWEAVQAGAISGHRLKNMLQYADLKRVKELATPKERKAISDSKKAAIMAMAGLTDSSGKRAYTQSEIAARYGISASTVAKILAGQ